MLDSVPQAQENRNNLTPPTYYLVGGVHFMIEFVALLGLAGLAVREKVIRKERRQARMTDVLSGARASVFSEALAGLVATSGGIYLSLVLLTTFLKITVPENVPLFSTNIEPLAGLAVILALVQPFLQRLWDRFRL